jgi:hypothetical protein
MFMNKLLFAALLLSGGLLAGQDMPATSNPSDAKDSKGHVTMQGCVSRANGDFVLMKQDPAITYELQATNKIKLSHYMGQRVEVTGKESASLATSSDSITRVSPAPTTLTINSIRTIDKECSVRDSK